MTTPRGLLPTTREMIEVMPAPDPMKMIKIEKSLLGEIVIASTPEMQYYTMQEYPQSVAKAIRDETLKRLLVQLCKECRRKL